MNNRKTPRIQFKGFTDDWEQRKLSELVTKYEDPVETPHDGYIRLGIRSHAKGTFHEYVEPGHELETAQMHRVATNKLIFNITFAWEHAVAIANENDAGKLVSHRFPQFTLLESLRPEFLKYVILDEGFHHNLYLASPGGAGRNRVLKIEEALDYPIYYPSLEEQHKIGELITTIDHLITLHQRKLEKLKIVKKAMLENCFPKNGEKVPKFRFSGFTGDWEQRKLGKVADKVTEKNSGLQYIETLTNSAEFGIISQRDFFDHDISKTSSLGGYYIVRSEDFVYNPRISVTAPVGPINRNKLGRAGAMSPLYTVFRPHDVDTIYLEHFFKSSCWHSFMNFNGDSGARSDRFSIKDNVFFEMPIPTPDIEEQGKIGKYLTHLDHLITLHQRKLEKLKIIKKSFLEKMFV